MTELDVARKLQTLRECLGRIKALLAWERLKRGEAQASRPWIFQMPDSTTDELRNEYSFFLTLVLSTYVALDHDPHVPAPVRQSARQRLAELEWQLQLLHLERRF